MPKTIISEGKTTTEAVEKGLKELNVTKDKVDIKVLENEEKRSFFSILEPRKVKVELSLKEGVVEQKEKKVEIKREVIKVEPEEIERAKNNIDTFLSSFLPLLVEESNYTLKEEDNTLYVEVTGKNVGKLIGYRGDTLNSLQVLISSIGNKNTKQKVKILVDIGEYRKKRTETLERLAINMAKSVKKNSKKVTLEPMSPFERKVIHSKLQDDAEITTYSIGEEPYRKVVITKIK